MPNWCSNTLIVDGPNKDIDLFFDKFTNNVTDQDVRFLNSGRKLGGNVKKDIDNTLHLAAALASQPNCHASKLLRACHGPNNVRGIAACAYPDHHIPRLCSGLDLPFEETIITIVITQTC